MAQSIMEQVAAAKAVVPAISPQDAAQLQAKGALIVDVRDAPELQASGKVKGAVHVSRGMLEFKADPKSPYHDPAFDPDKTVILYCASGGRISGNGRQRAVPDEGRGSARRIALPAEAGCRARRPRCKAKLTRYPRKAGGALVSPAFLAVRVDRD